jgi:hypothetical protein
MKRIFVFHPFGFALFPLLLIYAHNAGEVPPSELVVPLLIILGFVAAALLLLRTFIADVGKRSLTLSIFLLLLFSYGHAVRALRGLGYAGESPAGPEEIIFILWCILLTVLVYAGLRTRRDLRPLTKILNIVAAVLVAVQVVAGGNTLLSRPAITTGQNITFPDAPAAATFPNIYYIILDGYAREDVLQRLYGFDNSRFLSFLRNNGFYVADKSTANYCQTLLSLSSSLNLDYLQQLTAFDRDSRNRGPLVWLLQNNVVFEFLRHYGYTIIAPASGYTYTELVTADRYVHPGMTLSELDNSLLSLTPIPFVMRLGKTQYDFHRDRVHFIVNKLPSLQQGPAPCLVIAHIVSPHPPFVFGPDGETISRPRLFNFSDGSHYYREGGTPEEYLDGYRGQLAYLNRRIETMIREILDEAGDNPPLIILQADHGPGSHLDWDSLPATDLTERMSILNAYYLPGPGKNPLYPEITPVNTFRVVFNEYFGTQFPLLPDRNYFSTIDSLYHFRDVTSTDTPTPVPGNPE